MVYDFGFLNSVVAKNVFAIISPTINYETGHVASLPIIYISSKSPKIGNLTQANIHISKLDWDSYETSWDFKKHPLV